MFTHKLQLMTVGLDERSKEMAAKLFPNSTFVHLDKAPDFEKFLESPPAGSFSVIFCGKGIEGIQINEIAQSMRMQYANSAIFYITYNREGYERKVFIKNGFDDSFLLPLDEKTLVLKVEEMLAKLKDVKIKVFRPVKIVDIQPDTKVNFDVNIFMPANKKYIKMVNAGDEIDANQTSKLAANNIGSIFVPLDQMQEFYNYTVDRLKALGEPTGKLSETERKERLHSAVRDIFSSVFNVSANEATIQEGKALVQDCEKIVETYITKSEPGSWYQNLQQATAQDAGGDTYSHHSAVSTFAALFSIGLGLGKPADLAVAGLFHDIGLTDIPQEILAKPEAQWTPEEKKTYQLHPEMSVKIMKEKKLIVPPVVTQAVLQHHERFNGTGYPKGVIGKKICIEAQLVGLADEFDYLTRTEPGKKAPAPKEALGMIRAKNTFDPDLMTKVMALMPNDEPK